ncbi:MAG: hypothetical protein R2731_19605 [Nocardioides sp.]
MGGGIALANSPYERYLSLPEATVAPLPRKVALTLKLDGCATCRVKLVQAVKGRAAVWSTTWKKAKKGRVTVRLPRSRTAGLTVQVKAPWEGRPVKTTQVVVAYARKATGATVSAAAATKQKSGSPCFAGTSRSKLTWVVGVRRAKVAARSGLTLGSRAWLVTTREDIPPVLTTPRGVAATRGATKCG